MFATADGKLGVSVRRVYYTAKTVHATSGSRTSTGAIAKGYVVCFDPVGHDKGKGVDVAKPQDDANGDNSNLFAGIVTRLTRPDAPSEAQFIEIATPDLNKLTPIQAWTLADMSGYVAAPVFLGVTPGQWYLDDISTANTPNTIREFVAMAAGTENTSGGAGFGTVALI